MLSRGTICFLVRNLEFLVNISTSMESLQQGSYSYLFIKVHEHYNLVLDWIEQVVFMDQVKHISVT